MKNIIWNVFGIIAVATPMVASAHPGHSHAAAVSGGMVGYVVAAIVLVAAGVLLARKVKPSI